MFKIGEYNTLTIHRFTSVGAYLGEPDAGYDDVILLPNKYLKPGMQEGDELTVFVYLDTEERPVATTQTPRISLGKFEWLEVHSVNRIGAFLDWGLEKHLFVPYAEMVEQMEVGKKYLVGVFLDEKSERLVATPRIGKLLDQSDIQLKTGQEVDLVVYNETELGFQVMINRKHGGLVYENEVFRPIEVGDETKGYIKLVREDGKIDVSLEPLGVASIEPNSRKILDALNRNKGVLHLSDKSAPEDIEEQLHMSKKLFKKAIGGLYKQKLIIIEKDEIRSVIQHSEPERPKHL
ncbi:MAG: GntR family transcriptional regulator [Flavobacteriales bacterium]|nr:GntR family transcriptional regulator [Flavobacteriales bacterium]